jgi:asparagine synthase (glutamine-hydrolysing)
LRTVPLFYTTTKDNFVISDDAYYLKEKINSHFNEENAAEYMVAGYVTGRETLFDGIKQMRNGEFLTYQKKENLLKTSCYFRFLHGDYYELPESQLLEMLDHVFVNAFSRLIESTGKQGKKLVVPLSGGLDSRIIIAMLKRLGANDVLCMSYGRKGSRESRISKRIAEALGYNWVFVEYTAKKWHDCYNSKEADDYKLFAGNLSCFPHMQDFLAVKELKDQGKLPDNSVFVPGHAADMFSGSHLPRHYLDSSKKYNPETFLIEILKKYYILWKWPHGSELEHIFKEKINRLAAESELEIKDNESCVNAIEFFEFNERQPKLVVNSIRVYDFFGYEWRTPLLDAELIDFFLNVPIKDRINKSLYKKYAKNLLFSGELSILKKIDCTTDMVDLRAVDERSKYEKLLYYRTFIHSYYDEKINNPLWGRYFKDPLTSKLLTKVVNYENEAIEEYPLLKMILAYRNKEKYPLSINGLNSLEYLAKISGKTYSSASKAVLQPSVLMTKKGSVAKKL